MKHSNLSRSLIERAADIYDFGSALRVDPDAARRAEPAPAAFEPLAAQTPAFAPAAEAPAPRPEPIRQAGGATARVDRQRLADSGFIVPGAAPTGLAEEFRIVKRQILLGVHALGGIAADKRQSILICSASPDEGKTFCALNLALSLASEKDVEVLLVDGDFGKPEILSLLGLKAGPGLIDAIADPQADAESFVVRTDLGGLSVLPGGRQANNVTELLASARTRQVLNDLTAARPERIILFDSPPALMASPASALAAYVGQVVLVVRADQTNEADLHEAVALLAGCERLSLMLNGAGLAGSARRFGSYYGTGQ